MIVAITGICSGLGKALLPKLQRDPEIEKIIGVDINRYKGNREKLEFHKIDIRNYENLKETLINVDVLIHLAFIVIPNNMPKLNEIYEINILGSINAFRAAATQNVKKIIHLSSVAAYGHVPEVKDILTEDAPLLGIKTKSFYYSHTKAIVEKYIEKFENKYPNIRFVILRPPIIAGKNFFNNLKFLHLFSRIKFIPKGTRPDLMQLVHEDDLTNVILLAIKKDYTGAFNISAKPVNLSSVLRRFYGKKSKIFIPNIIINLIILLGKICKPLSRYTGWLQAAKHNGLLINKKIKRTFKWKPKFSTERCLIETIKRIQKKNSKNDNKKNDKYID
ncbi:MAG: NAD-dependent epimerase/dehydratase family protein [Candidatus Lokiarchaeota archaeon]|nr:NAD-dependent epimerase/dehydratase family protein [Candidatus Lokiarchaeota archaeon]